ncbi:extracellular catalytic domain type 2 short-chain-length polyhydroxyalkanoate depolymerase [Streptomyces atriruber]|uniref:extracellular catalytic domain type 2 short-chain-length polyhydroxyalkanoate depolymerase n=1 Tax=Streptomyces atriruber TaxID=545121 RepID=UPI0006E44AF3|nr:PHB depolymerase family esterase [Streptomyces atriruber]
MAHGKSRGKTPLTLVAALALTCALGLGGTTAAAAVPTPIPGELRPYDIESTYVSGVSSGGYLADQLHVAHSAVFKGAGIFSAGAYDCAQGSVNTALYACMDTYLPRRTPAQLEQLTRERAAAGRVDPVANLSGDPVWLYHGGNDGTVDRPVNDDLAAYHRDFGANVSYDTSSPAGHAWVSPLGKVPCATTASPYVNTCGTDPERAMLTHLFGAPVNPATTAPLDGTLVRFDQNRHVPGGNAAAVSMGKDGFAYVPESCADGSGGSAGSAGSCRLMVALHGCQQTFGQIGDTFMSQAHLNEYADTNRMIVLYPQATTALDNPRGCWNWWGYGGDTHYADKSGRQITTIMSMVKQLGG